jgi:MGT family glycosyltransferase
MARFLVGTMPLVGHVNPAFPIVRQLIENGHEVQWYTGQLFQAKIEATGATYLPMTQAPDYSDPEVIKTLISTEREKLTGLPQLKFDLKHVFLDAAIGQVADLTDVIATFQPDVMLADAFFFGASFLSEKTGIPWAQLGTTIFTPQSCDTAPAGLGWKPDRSWLGRLRNRSLNAIFQHLVFRDITQHAIQVRSKLGLSGAMPLPFDFISPYLYLSGTVPSFEYPRRDLPPQVHFIGPLLPPLPTTTTDRASWQDLPRDRPIVHVTQGTVATDPQQLIVPTLEALAEEKVWVIATTGGQPIDKLNLPELPANAIVEPFIPHGILLPNVEIMITNGGYNGVQVALSHGVPLITAGATEDKPEVCARVAWSGVGINLKTNTPTRSQIKTAVQEMLANPTYKQRAQTLQAEIQHCDGATRSVELLERLAVTREAVVR